MEQKKIDHVHMRLRLSKAISELGLLALSDLNIRDLMNTAVKQLAEILDVEYTKILELKPDKQTMILRAGHGWNKDIKVDRSTVGTGENSQAGYTLKSSEAVIVLDLPEEKRFTGPKLLKDHFVRSGISVIIYGSSGKPYGVLGIHTTEKRTFSSDDIGYLQSVANIIGLALARHKTQTALQASEERFRLTADTAPVLIWMAADKQRYWFNTQWLNFTGRSIEQESGRNWLKNVYPEDMDTTKESIAAAYKKKTDYKIEYRLKRHDGAYRWMLDHGVPRYDSSDNFIGYIGSCIDIHKRVMEAKQKDDFVSMASHELKTPITSLVTYISVLETALKKQNLKKGLDYVKKLSEQSDKLKILVNELLNLTVIRAGKLKLKKSSFNITKLIKETAEMLQDITPSHTISVKGDKQIMVKADKEKIYQVLVNLITNAIKYSPNTNDVEVAINHTQADVTVAVKDYGMGIPAEYQETIFELFNRVSEPREKTFPGLGVGLYISSQVIREHGSKIHVSSTPGKGSTFSFKLPLV